MATKISPSSDATNPAQNPVDGQQWTAVNVHPLERWVSGLGGGALAAYGLFRRDLSGLVLGLLGGGLAYRGISGHSFAYQATGLNTAGQEQQGSTGGPHTKGIKVEKAITIDKPVAELYQFWHNFENLPRFMHHLQSVTVSDLTHSHWVTSAPAGTQVEWDAEVITDRPDELIAWRSLPGSTIDNAGSVHFTSAPGDRGTEVRVVLEYVSPVGKPGVLVARLFGEDVEQQVYDDLKNLKQIIEIGEVSTTAGQPSGRKK